MKRFLLLALLLAPARAWSQASVLLRAEVAPKEITIGDRVDVAVTVIYSTAITPAPVEFPKTAGEFEVLSTASSKPEKEKSGRMTVVHRLALTTFSTGTVTIPALSLYFQNADASLAEAKTDPLTITVKSVMNEKDDGGLRPLKGLYNAPALWPVWALIIAAALGLAGWLVWRRRKLMGPAAAQGPAEPALSPEAEAEQALAAIETGPLMTEGNEKDLYSALSAVLRRYAERRYGINASEMTTSELLHAFRSAVPTEPGYVARAFLDNADLVKFAKWTPPFEDVTADVARVRTFVQATTPQPPAPAETPPEEAVPL